MKIGVVSDTHLPNTGKDFPEELIKELKKVDLIIHAGDHCELRFLNKLKSIAEVKTVVGNRDSYQLQKKLKDKITFEAGGKKISVIHGHQFRGRNILQGLNYSFVDSDIIVFGHTHRPFNERVSDKLFFNPGSPTDKRLEKNYTFGIIEIEEEIKAEIKILKEES
ncbi:MAG: phosphodiesterase [Halanaerobium sp.]|nr:MAG: phosphodiesterase [Halanaerobium sp.]